MSVDDPPTSDSPPAETYLGSDSAVVMPSRLRVFPNRIFSRVATLSKVDGLSEDIIKGLNLWYQSEWRIVHASRFTICPAVTESLRRFFATHQSPPLTAEHVESYLRASCLLYYGLRGDTSSSTDVSKNKFFQRYYYTARENACALNSMIVMSNFLWACNHYIRDDFANSCLLDILLQAFPAALESFVKLRGVTYLRTALDFLASSGKLRSSTNYLLKALALLNKLEISFRVLQTSRIGITVNGIATGGKNVKLGIDYDCDNDTVKLKATDLIKKWKAIRDASQPVRVEPEPRRVARKPAPSSQSPKRRIEETSPVASRRDEMQPNGTSSGSFVLNILDSMVEQREKERKRKIAMKEAQRSGLFKVSRSGESDDNAAARAPSEPSNQAATGVPDSTGQSGTAVESRKELQSLMNFFKSFKPQVSTTPLTGDAFRGATPTASTTTLPSVRPSVAINGDQTGLSVPSNNFTHMVGVASGPVVGNAPSGSSAGPSSHITTSMAHRAFVTPQARGLRSD
ncbi:uncharacterized protein BXIN_0041 [Babesia sp. Xinjiang]|uniref:uncharacterized protein n=1 Tax=Babesia sp. Xinjiang TaxID=462227 RepID=UPI000A238B27|nr:uncharacterized protein BXIN_0041 [Babesia sp. Xinjiang]ORM39713.1 hypothetical protein BXIN_0041 [Babesia sp. Xinjiang]